MDRRGGPGENTSRLFISDQKKRRNKQQKKYAPILKKMNAEEEDLNVNQRLDLILPDKTVEKIMGAEPVPSLDIEMDEIQNELQRKMVEEV